MSQRKAAKFVFNNYSRYSSVTSMLHQLNWDSLEQRRTKATITMLYKIIDNIVSVNFQNIFNDWQTGQEVINLNFQLSKQEPILSTTPFLNLIFRAIRLWNSLIL